MNHPISDRFNSDFDQVFIPQRFIQTELGAEKYCKGCDEYYPADREFFFGTGSFKKDGSPCLETLCKACYKEKYKRSTKRSNDVSHRYEVLA